MRTLADGWHARLKHMTLYVYVDHLNLSVEGQRLAAVNTGLAFDMHDAISRDVIDHSWTCDLGKTYQAVRPPDESIARSSLFGDRPHAADSLWDLATQHGFDVAVFDSGNTVEIATHIMADSYEHMRPGDTAVLLAGDKDYLPVVEALQSRQLGVRVAFWDHATGRELKCPPAEFFSLDAVFDGLSR